MKKAGILTLTLILIAAMFSGCRGTTTTTTGTTNGTAMPTTSQTMTQSTAPSTTTVIPNITEPVPSTDATDGTDMSRGRTAPRY